MIEFMQVAVVIFGFCATSYSLRLAYKIYKIQHPLTLAIALEVLGNSTAAFITFLFSINSMVHTLDGIEPELWNTLSPELALVFRIIIFSVLLCTTMVLTNKLDSLGD